MDTFGAYRIFKQPKQNICNEKAHFTLLAGQRLILNLWLEKSAAPLHVLHGGYGVGSLSVPLYSNPFLAVPMPTAATNITNGTSSNDTGAINDSDPQPVRYLKESRIEYAYAISAALVALLSVVFYFYQIKAYKASNAKRGVSDKGAIITADKKGIVNLTFDGKEDTQEVKDPTTDSTESRNNQGTTIGEMSNKTGLEQPPASTTTTKSRTWREMFNPATCSGGRLAYGIQLLVLLSFYFANANGGERIAASFVRSFSIDQLDFEGDEASFLNTSLWISHTVGRFVFFIAARWIGIRKLVLIETVGVTIISVLLSIFGVSSSTACWVLIQPLGFFIAPLWPSMIAWADHHIELTGVGMTLFLCAGGIGGLCHMRLMGYLYEHFGPRMFLYQLTGYGIIALLLTVGLTIVGAQHGSRFKWNNKREIEKSVVKGKADVTSMEKF